MDKIIVYIDDAGHALQQLTPMLLSGGRTRWVLVACPPRMSRHIGKWLDTQSRDAWRASWCGTLHAKILPALRQRGDDVTTVNAHGALAALTRTLQQQHGPARVLDARRPKFGLDLQPVTTDQPTTNASNWALPGSVATLGAVIFLAAD